MGLNMSVQEFLNSLSSKGTKKTYKHGLKKFLEWYGKSAEEVLKERKDDLTQRPEEDLVSYRNRASNYEKIIERFHRDMVNEGYSPNTARSLTMGIRQLFRYYKMDVKMRNGANVNRTIKTSRNFPMTIEHVRKMFAVANFRDRVILSMATDLGLRISDFLNIKKDDLPDLTQEPPISFDVMTDKEDVVAHGFLSKESIDLLKKYALILPEPNPFLFPSSQKAPKPISQTQLGNILKDLANKAEIKINNRKRLSFHCFRKMFLSASIDSGIGLTAGKMMVGKTISSSDATYLTTVKLREKFIQLKRFLSISEQPIVENQKVEALTKAVNVLQENVVGQKTINEAISQKNMELTQKIERLEKEKESLETKIQELQPLKEKVAEIDKRTTLFSNTWSALLEELKADLLKTTQKKNPTETKEGS